LRSISETFLIRHSAIKTDIFRKASIQGSNWHGKGSLINTVAFSSHGFKDCLHEFSKNNSVQQHILYFTLLANCRILEQWILYVRITEMQVGLFPCVFCKITSAKLSVKIM